MARARGEVGRPVPATWGDMVIFRILANAIIMAAELAAVIAVAALAFYHPFIFAAVTAALAFLFGLKLEVARLRYELPFYFGGLARTAGLFTGIVGFVEAAFKGIVAGFAALFTFSGTNTDRLFLVTVVFGICVYAGAALLRYLSIKSEALPMRWGYFRLAPLLGLLFSIGMTLLAVTGLMPQSSVSDIGWKIIFELPERPSIEQVSEILFQVKQAFDQFVVTMLSQVVDEGAARAIAVVLSVNVLSGFVSAVYAAMISQGVRRAEEALL